MSELGRQPAYLQQAVRRLSETLGENLLGIVLFGSYARGEARDDSDVDLLVIARGLPESRYDRAVQLHRLLSEIHNRPDISVLGKTPDEFEGHFPSLYLDLGLDGIVLFDRDGYTLGKLERIREIIDEAGLGRRQENDSLAWNWRQPPGLQWEVTWDGFREFA